MLNPFVYINLTHRSNRLLEFKGTAAVPQATDRCSLASDLSPRVKERASLARCKSRHSGGENFFFTEWR